MVPNLRRTDIERTFLCNTNHRNQMDTFRIRGACTHDFKNIDLDLPRDRLIVLKGISRSGKSSLPFDTIYATRTSGYVESLSA
uniref:UvrABC system protein A n=1 Tax=Candidatus Kentrum sp. LPFa TaxID=2126335 RepID=A0A450WGF2_9GAMM|nr:MAG: hypothetical protein BECKLPF1236B_GA0070989_10892 [Candidatus Kentron sp. LPFa]